MTILCVHPLDPGVPPISIHDERDMPGNGTTREDVDHASCQNIREESLDAGDNVHVVIAISSNVDSHGRLAGTDESLVTWNAPRGQVTIASATKLCNYIGHLPHRLAGFSNRTAQLGYSRLSFELFYRAVHRGRVVFVRSFASGREN
jgi:hypothetical protein